MLKEEQEEEEGEEEEAMPVHLSCGEPALGRRRRSSCPRAANASKTVQGSQNWTPEWLPRRP